MYLSVRTNRGLGSEHILLPKNENSTHRRETTPPRPRPPLAELGETNKVRHDGTTSKQRTEWWTPSRARSFTAQNLVQKRHLDCSDDRPIISRVENSQQIPRCKFVYSRGCSQLATSNLVRSPSLYSYRSFRKCNERLVILINTKRSLEISG